MNFSIIQKSQLEGALRLDAEYYQPEYLELENKLLKLNSKLFSEISIIRSGTTPKDRDDDQKEGIVLLKTTDVRNNVLVEENNYYYISRELDKKMKQTRLASRDVLVNIVGATLGVIGRTAFVPNRFPESNITQAMALVRSKDRDFLPEYIFVFLISKLGRMQADRIARPTGQYNINLEELGSFKIPAVAIEIQQEIKDLVDNLTAELNESKKLYSGAENFLLEKLGLKNFGREEKLFSIVNLSDVESVHRMDAEYFQPKYAEVIGKIEKYNGGWDYVKNQFKQNKELLKIDKDFYNYVEISDVNIANGEIMPTKINLHDIPANGKIKLFKNDLLISKVRPYRGAVSFIDFEMDNLLGSGAFTILQEKAEYKKEVLMVFLKTTPIKELLLRYNCGTSYPVIKDDDILNLKIPLLDKETQQKISELVIQSHEARKKSKELLEEAKRKVEEMIEKQ